MNLLGKPLDIYYWCMQIWVETSDLIIIERLCEAIYRS